MHTTLNLLAPEKKTALRAGFVLSHMQATMFILFIVASFISGTLLSIELLMKSVLENITLRSNTTAQEYDKIGAQITDVNAYLDRVDSLQQEFIDWSFVLEELAAVATSGARFESIHIDGDGVVFVQGMAATREDVLLMQERYETLPFITDVSSPLSNILQRTNVKYEFTMRYEEAGPEATGVISPSP